MSKKQKTEPSYENLPDLPQLRKKREAKITPRVLDWFRENGPSSCALEIKVCKGNKLPASALLPHQRRALLDVCGSGIVHKLSDEARRKQPYDAFKLSFARAYVCVVFLTTPRVCLVIDIKKWPASVTRATPSDYSFDI